MLIVLLNLLLILWSLARKGGRPAAVGQKTWFGFQESEVLPHRHQLHHCTSATYRHQCHNCTSAPYKHQCHTDTSATIAPHTHQCHQCTIQTSVPLQYHTDTTSTIAPHSNQYYHYCTTKSGQIAPAWRSKHCITLICIVLRALNYNCTTMHCTRLWRRVHSCLSTVLEGNSICSICSTVFAVFAPHTLGICCMY